MHIPKWLIATAGLVFVMLIAAIAFYIGRESSRPPAAEIIATTVPQDQPAVKGPEQATPPLAEPSRATGSVVTPSASDTAPTKMTIPSSASTPSAAVDNSPAAADARARVAAYFTQMDAIQSGAAIGDAEEFATTIVNAALSGNLSGIDDLVRSAGDAERRAIALQPPDECADYHRLAITLLQESRALATTLRDGLKRNDADALTSVGASAQAMKSRAENLAATEKALRARFGL